MRRATRSLSLLVFAVALAYALGCAWVAQQFGDETEFADLTSSMARDPDVRNAISHAVVVHLTQENGVPHGWATPIAEATSRAFDDAMVNGRFDDAWQESMLRSHRKLFTDPIPETVQVDVAPFLEVVINDSDLLQRLGATAPEELLLPVAEVGPTERPVIAGIMTATHHRVWAWIVVALAGLVALVSSSRRKLGGTVMALGGLSLVVAVAWGVLGRWQLTELVQSAVARDRSTAAVTASFGTLANDSLQAFLIPVAAIGLVVIVAGALVRATARGQD